MNIKIDTRHLKLNFVFIDAKYLTFSFERFINFVFLSFVVETKFLTFEFFLVLQSTEYPTLLTVSLLSICQILFAILILWLLQFSHKTMFEIDLFLPKTLHRTKTKIGFFLSTSDLEQTFSKIVIHSWIAQQFSVVNEKKNIFFLEFRCFKHHHYIDISRINLPLLWLWFRQLQVISIERQYRLVEAVRWFRFWCCLSLILICAIFSGC